MSYIVNNQTIITDSNGLLNIKSVDTNTESVLTTELSDISIGPSATIYDSEGEITTINNGDLIFLRNNRYFKIYDSASNRYYNISVGTNKSPIISGFNAAYTVSTSQVITVTGTDSDGDPLTFSASGNTAFNSFASVSQNENVFTVTITDSSTDNSGLLTFSVTDNINTTTGSTTISFTAVIAYESYAADRTQTDSFEITHTPFKTKLNGESADNPPLWVNWTGQYGNTWEDHEFPFDHANNVLYTFVMDNSSSQKTGLAKFKFTDTGTVKNLWISDSLASTNPTGGPTGYLGGRYYPGDSPGDGHIVTQVNPYAWVVKIKNDDTGQAVVQKFVGISGNTTYNGISLSTMEIGKFNPSNNRYAWLGFNTRLTGTPSQYRGVLRNARYGWQKPLNSTNFGYTNLSISTNKPIGVEWIDSDYFVVSTASGTVHYGYKVTNWNSASPTIGLQWTSGSDFNVSGKGGVFLSNGDIVYYINNTNIYRYKKSKLQGSGIPPQYGTSGSNSADWTATHSMKGDVYSLGGAAGHGSTKVTAGGDIRGFYRNSSDPDQVYYRGYYLDIDSDTQTITTREIDIGSPTQTIYDHQMTYIGYCNGHLIWSKNYYSSYRSMTVQQDNIDSPGIFSAF